MIPVRCYGDFFYTKPPNITRGIPPQNPHPPTPKPGDAATREDIFLQAAVDNLSATLLTIADFRISNLVTRTTSHHVPVTKTRQIAPAYPQ